MELRKMLVTEAAMATIAHSGWTSPVVARGMLRESATRGHIDEGVVV
jgi:hypothetical protein